MTCGSVTLMGIAFGAAVVFGTLSASAQQYQKVSPYDAIRWNEGKPEVRVGSDWVGLVAIDGVEVDRIVAFAREQWRDLWQKRFEQDLVEVLSKMGNPPGEHVSLRVRALNGGATRELPKVRMTAENRKAILSAATPESAPPWISRAQAEEDLAILRSALINGFSYLQRRGVDLDGEIDRMRTKLGERVDRPAFGIALMRFLALFGDGHTRLSADPGDFLPGGFAPFLANETGRRIVAFKPDRSALCAPDAPFLVAIDGIGIEKWIDAARAISPRGAGHFERRQCVRNLRFITFLRGELGLPVRESVDLGVESLDRGVRKTVSLPLATRRPTFGAWPRARTRELSGGIGYLRLESMDGSAEFLASLDAAVDRFAKTRGLVIDVRGNGGGSREPVRRLVPRFLKGGGAPRVINVAAARIRNDEDPRRPDGYLGNRFLYPAAWSGWSDPERNAIAAVARTFQPEWKPAGGRFSEWHYCVVSPGAKVERYEKPVVVLLDGDCFSATDIFVGAFKGLDRVTLMGTTSGGGSGRAREVHLPRSGISVQFSSMASYLPSGRLYDGNGVEPDVLMEPAPTDFIGTTDAVLDAALAVLKR